MSQHSDVNPPTPSKTNENKQLYYQYGQPNIGEILKDGGVDVNCFNVYCFESSPGEPLSHACKEGNIFIVKLLLDLNADTEILARGCMGHTPLYHAEGHVKFKLKSMIEYHDGFNREWDPLTTACYYGHLEVVKTLVEAGAKIVRVYKNVLTPLDSACIGGYKEIVIYLLKKIKEIDNSKESCEAITPILESSSSSSRSSCSSSGSSLRNESRKFGYPLFNACRGGYIDIVKILVEDGFEVDGVNNTSPLSTAAHYGYYDIVEYLLNKRAKIEDDDYNSPLHCASYNGHSKVVECLIKHGAKIDGYFARKEWKPIDLAYHMGHTQIVNILMEKGATRTECTDNKKHEKPKCCWQF